MKKSLFNKAKGINLDLGAGENRQGTYLTVDKRKEVKPDILWDIQEFPYPIPDEVCNTVLMSHVYEHIEPKYRMQMIDEIWRIMKVGGQLLLSTPYYQSFWACQDPTHYTCPTEATFTYFDPDYNLYKVYKPKPWKLKQNNYTLDGNVEIIMEKRGYYNSERKPKTK